MDIEQSLLNIEIEILFRTIGNIKSALKDAEQRKRFFREYRDHSKVLAKVICEGFGNDSGIFGLCKYDKGKLQRNNPKIPEIENIGLATEHLKNGYAGIWGRKEKAEKVAIDAYDNIENLINQYEKIVSDSIPKSYFIARNDEYSPRYSRLSEFLS